MVGIQTRSWRTDRRDQTEVGIPASDSHAVSWVILPQVVLVLREARAT